MGLAGICANPFRTCGWNMTICFRVISRTNNQKPAREQTQRITSFSGYFSIEPRSRSYWVINPPKVQGSRVFVDQRQAFFLEKTENQKKEGRLKWFKNLLKWCRDECSREQIRQKAHTGGEACVVSFRCSSQSFWLGATLCLCCNCNLKWQLSSGGRINTDNNTERLLVASGRFESS